MTFLKKWIPKKNFRKGCLGAKGTPLQWQRMIE